MADPRDAEIARLRQQLAAAQAEIARLTERCFPIMGGPSIPWAMIAPYERQALRNHNQTLERLAERGGLSPMEAMAVFDGHRLRPPYEAEAAALGRLRQLLREYEQQHATPAPGAPLLDAVRGLVEAGVSVVGDLETERDECESPGTRQSLDATISYLSSRLAAVRAVLSRAQDTAGISRGGDSE